MAIVRTARSSTTHDIIASASYVSSTFTPSNNSLLVAILMAEASTAAISTDAWSGAGGGLTWTRRRHTSNGGAFSCALEFFTAPVTTGASMTVTLSHAATGGDFWGCLQVVEYTGHNVSSPIGAVAVGAHDLLQGAVAISLDTGPSTTSTVIAARGFAVDGGGSTTATPGIEWSEIYDTSIAAAMGLQCQDRSGSTSNAVNWDDVDTSGDTSHFSAAAAIEIVAAGPIITAQPADVSAYNGDTANFAVTATGGSLTYQWQVSTDRCATYGNVSGGSGATTASYTTATLAFSDHETFYRCAVTDADGTTNTRGAALRITPRSTLAWLIN